MCINKISSISPVLKTNNRNVNQEFFEKVLGWKLVPTGSQWFRKELFGKRRDRRPCPFHGR